MYELRLSPSEKEKFVNVARYRLYNRNMTLKDLAAKIDRPVNSVYGFFNSYKKKPNRFLAAEIANALNMKQSDWR
jgi:hypothetical protein